VSGVTPDTITSYPMDPNSDRFYVTKINYPALRARREYQFPIRNKGGDPAKRDFALLNKLKPYATTTFNSIFAIFLSAVFNLSSVILFYRHALG